MQESEKTSIPQLLGGIFSEPISGTGNYVLFCVETFKSFLFPPPKRELLFKQLEFVGIKSIGIIVMAGCMIGGVFGLQLGKIFGIFRAESMLGAAAAFALSKELAPVIGAFLVTGRAGSAMAAEIATMRVNEQIDAMRVMAVNPYSYLIAPRVMASLIMMPLLNGIFIVSGVATAYLVGVMIYDVDVGQFFLRIENVVKTQHLMEGMHKAIVFGFIFSTVGCYKGFNAGRGASGVGQATTSAVVIALVTILIADFFISYLQFKLS